MALTCPAARSAQLSAPAAIFSAPRLGPRERHQRPLPGLALTGARPQPPDAALPTRIGGLRAAWKGREVKNWGLCSVLPAIGKQFPLLLWLEKVKNPNHFRGLCLICQPL